MVSEPCAEHIYMRLTLRNHDCLKSGRCTTDLVTEQCLSAGCLCGIVLSSRLQMSLPAVWIRLVYVCLMKQSSNPPTPTLVVCGLDNPPIPGHPHPFHWGFNNPVCFQNVWFGSLSAPNRARCVASMFEILLLDLVEGAQIASLAILNLRKSPRPEK